MISSSRLRPPVIIGATGGSGTRVVREILRHAGVYTGVRVNNAGDALDFVKFFDVHIPAALRVTRTLNYRLADLPETVGLCALSDLQRLIAVYCTDIPPESTMWGFKNPRAMYVLPYIERLFPNFFFIHVIRDGRDMSLSQNQGQMRKHYEDMFGESIAGELEFASARLWNKANSEVADWCRDQMQDRYRLIRYEDLCRNPIVSTVELCDWLSIPVHNDLLTLVQSFVRPSADIGRWHRVRPEIIAAITARCQPSLQRFGYT